MPLTHAPQFRCSMGRCTRYAPRATDGERGPTLPIASGSGAVGRSPRSRTRRGTPGSTPAVLGAPLSDPGQGPGHFVVDNGSTGPESSPTTYGWLEVVANDENQGFARGCNQGAAKARRLSRSNSDTVVALAGSTNPSLRSKRTDVGAVAMLRQRVGEAEGDGRSRSPRYPDAFVHSPVQGAARGKRRHDGSLDFVSRVRTSSFHGVGGFDERFEIGGFEDDDLCRRLHQNDLRLLMADGSFVHHSGHASLTQTIWRGDATRESLSDSKRRGPDDCGAPSCSPPACVPPQERGSKCWPPAWNAVRDLLDEIVVYDTGSNDRTTADCQRGGRHGGGVRMGGFLCGRPERRAARHATGEWVLSIHR